MKTLITIVITILLSIAVNGFISAQHYNLFNVRYEACKTKFIAENNYQSNEQIFSCVKESMVFRLMGTLLFLDGSYLEDVSSK